MQWLTAGGEWLGALTRLWHAALNQIHAAALLLASLPALFGSVDTGADIPHDVFGGTLTEVGPSNMPSGGSPRNLNVEFLPGMVRTRGGLQQYASYAGVAGGPWQVRWAKGYGSAPEDVDLLALLYNPVTGASVVVNGTSPIGSVYGFDDLSDPVLSASFAGPLAKSCTQFGREYIAISDGRYGHDLPRQWDGTNYDRVSQCGPGRAPSAANSALTQAIAASPNGLKLAVGTTTISLIQQVGNVTYVYPDVYQTGFYNAAQYALPGDTIVISGTAHYNGTFAIDGFDGSGFFFTGVVAGQPAETSGTIETGYYAVTPAGAPLGIPAAGNNLTIAGAGVSGYDGTWPIRETWTSATNQSTFPAIIYVTPGLANSGGGTMNAPGSISAGLHQVSVAFITRQGYITKPAPPSSWTAAGGVKADISNIPIGPSNVVARLLIFTPYLTPPATTGTFYSVRQTDYPYTTVMQINDNATTSLTVDFSDSDLTTGFNAQYLFGLVELGECSGVFAHAGRLFWWGELASNQEFLNLSFNGGWNIGGGTGGNDLPLGWTSPAGSVGSGKRLADGGAWLDAYQITGTGGSGNVGTIAQPAFQNYLGIAILGAATKIGARVTASATSPNASLVVDVYSPSSGVLASIELGAWATTFSTFAENLSPTLPAVIPSDAVLRIYAANGTMAGGQSITIDRIEIFAANQRVNYTALRASYASDPESFDGVTGLIQPVYSNGEAVRAVYTLRDSMYLTCDRSTYVTKDTGDEPAGWPCDPVSAVVGCCGPSAAAAGEDWEVKVNRYGLYIYLGKEPEKLSQEIQTLWNKAGYATLINWQCGYKVWAAVDLQNKRVYVGAPTGTNIEPDTIFVMDYNTLDTSEMIAQYPTLRFSPYTGRRVILEQGRKWTIWQFSRGDGSGFNRNVPFGAFIEEANALAPSGLPTGLARFVLGGDGSAAGNADGTLWFIDPTKRGNDNGVAVTSNYATHFFPTQDEEQGLQLRSHMHGFSFGRFYVQGAGKMNVTAYHNNLADPSPKQASIDLSNPALQDAEETFDDFTAERYALLWQTDQLNGWFQMERMTRVVEMDPTGLVRGTNLQ